MAPPPPPIDRLSADVVRRILDDVDDDPASLARLLCAARASSPSATTLLREAACERRWKTLFARRWCGAGAPGVLAERAAAAAAEQGGFRKLYSERAEAERVARVHAARRQEAGIHEDEDAQREQDELEAWMLARRRVQAQAQARQGQEQQQQHAAEEQRLRDAFLASRRACTAGCASEVAALLDEIARVPAPSADASVSSCSPSPSTPDLQTTLRAVFLVDGSGSVTKREFDRAREFLSRAIEAVERGVADAAPSTSSSSSASGPLLGAEVSVVQFSTTARIEGTAVLVAPGGASSSSSSTTSSSGKEAELRLLASGGVSALRARVRNMARMAGGTSTDEGLRQARAIFERSPALDEAAVVSARIKAEERARALRKATVERDAAAEAALPVRDTGLSQEEAAVAARSPGGGDEKEQAGDDDNHNEEAAAERLLAEAKAAHSAARRRWEDAVLALRDRLLDEEDAVAARNGALVDAVAEMGSISCCGLMTAYQRELSEQRELESERDAAAAAEAEAARLAERAAFRPRLFRARRALAATQAAHDAADAAYSHAQWAALAARKAVVRRVVVLLTDGRVSEHDVNRMKEALSGVVGGGGELETYVVGFSARFDPHLLAPVAEVSSTSLAAAAALEGEEEEEEQQENEGLPATPGAVDVAAAAGTPTSSSSLTRAGSLPLSPSMAAVPRCVRLMFPPLVDEGPVPSSAEG
jgi:hypothetical protein